MSLIFSQNKTVNLRICWWAEKHWTLLLVFWQVSHVVGGASGDQEVNCISVYFSNCRLTDKKISFSSREVHQHHLYCWCMLHNVQEAEMSFNMTGGSLPSLPFHSVSVLCPIILSLSIISPSSLFLLDPSYPHSPSSPHIIWFFSLSPPSPPSSLPVSDGC